MHSCSDRSSSLTGRLPQLWLQEAVGADKTGTLVYLCVCGSRYVDEAFDKYLRFCRFFVQVVCLISTKPVHQESYLKLYKVFLITTRHDFHFFFLFKRKSHSSVWPSCLICLHVEMYNRWQLSAAISQTPTRWSCCIALVRCFLIPFLWANRLKKISSSFECKTIFTKLKCSLAIS